MFKPYKKEIQEAIDEGYLWLDLDSSQFCEQEPLTPNKVNLAEFLLLIQ